MLNKGGPLPDVATRANADAGALICPGCGAKLPRPPAGSGTVATLTCSLCGGTARVRRRGPVESSGSPAPPLGEMALAARVWALGALQALYPAVTTLGAALVFACGGFVPAARGWLQDEIADWPEFIAALGGVWVSGPSPKDLDADLGPVIARGDAPGLFDQLKAIARALGARVPRQVRLTYLPCCGITTGDRERALILGLPLLHVLNQGELRAVLTHELAHLAHGDATHTARRARFVEELERALDSLDGTEYGPLGAWARFCGRFGSIIIAPVARGQEERADRAAADYAGGDATASALVKVALVQGLFREVLEHYDPDRLDQPNLYAFFRAFWSRLPESFHTEARHRHFADGGSERGGGSGSHPSLFDRICHAQAYPPGLLTRADLAPAAALVGDLEAIEQMLHNRLFGIEDLSPSVFHRAGT